MENLLPLGHEVSPVLFLDEEGSQMFFSVRGSEKFYEPIISLIRDGGGFVTVRRNGPNTILLDYPTARILGEQEVYSTLFIVDSCRENALQDLNKYRLNKQSKYCNSFDANEVLLKLKSWGDIPLASPVEHEVEFSNPVHLSRTSLKKIARPYSSTDRIAIVEYIIKRKGYKYVKGNSFWKTMEEENILEGRTWQSLKEHFKKKILPQIHTFGLEENTVKKFKKI